LIGGESHRLAGRQRRRISTTDESRRLDRKVRLEGWQPTQVGGKPDGTAGGSIEGASWKLTRRRAGRSVGGASRRSVRKQPEDATADEIRRLVLEAEPEG